MTALLPQPVTVFVGREYELGLLRAALAAAIAGHGRLVLLAGEPGIGKTRLAEEFAAHAAAEGATVRWGRCREGAGAPAFWPWIQILRAEIKETDPEELRAQLGSGTEEMVRLVPELRERMPGVAVAPLADDAGARFRLFDSALAAEILDLSDRSGFRERAMWARIYRFMEAMEQGDVAAMERDLPVYAKLADELRQPFFRSRALGMRAALGLLGGRFAEAEQLALEALQLMHPAEDPLVLQESVAQLSVVYWEQGRYGEFEGFV